MIETLNTSTSKPEIDSVFLPAKIGINNSTGYKIQEMSVFDARFLFSVELQRQKVKTELQDWFEFEHSSLEVDFLISNEDVRRVLPSIGRDFKKSLGSETPLSLYLLSEDEGWETLFINIHAGGKLNWDYYNEFRNEFFDNMFDLFPKVAERLNIDIVDAI